MEHETNIAAVRGIYAAMRDRDLAAYRSLVHPELEVRQPSFLPYGGVHTGVDAVLAMFGEVLRIIDVKQLEVTRLTAGENRVWAEILVRARATGVPMEVAEHWRLRDGRAEALDVWFHDPRPLLET